MLQKLSVTSGEVAMFEVGKTLLVTDVVFVMIVKECVRSMCDWRELCNRTQQDPNCLSLPAKLIFYFVEVYDVFQIPVLSVSLPRSNVLPCPKAIREDS